MSGLLSLPAEISPAIALGLCAASFLTSGFTAAFGIGGGVSLLALMGFLLPVGVLIPVHGIVQLGSNAGRALVQRSHIGWPVLAVFLAGAVIGALLGARFVVELDDALLKILLGAFILLTVWLKLPALQKAGWPTFGLGGFATTFASMFVGATGPLVIILFEKLFAERRQVVATHAAAMVAQHSLKVAAFALAGFAFAQWLPLLAAMIATGFAGTLAGSRLLNAMPEAAFRTGFRIVMTLLALLMIVRGIAAALG